MQQRVDGPPFVHLTRPRSAQLYLIYGGMDAYIDGASICSMGLLRFMQISGLSGRNLTWIRDPNFNNFAGGFSEEVPNLLSLEAWHEQHIASMPHVREVYTLGYSSGAYAALWFAHRLRAKKAWAFSPRTADGATDAEAKQALRERLSTTNGSTAFEIWYAARNRMDRHFAENVGDCPGVTVHPHRLYGGTHFLLDRMIESGEFQRLLPPDPGIAAVTPPSMVAD